MFLRLNWVYVLKFNYPLFYIRLIIVTREVLSLDMPIIIPLSITKMESAFQQRYKKKFENLT